VQYHNERLVVDKSFADDLMRGICKIAVDVEMAYGGVPQVSHDTHVDESCHTSACHTYV